MNTNLRDLIKESIQGYIREIDMVSEIAAVESKINETTKAIEERNGKLDEAERLNESGLIDEKKVKQFQKEVALLEKYKAKQEALLEKLKAKKAKHDEKNGKTIKSDDVIDETADMTDETMDMTDETMDLDETSDVSLEEGEELEETEINESFNRMQKLAGIKVITESKKKLRKTQ